MRHTDQVTDQVTAHVQQLVVALTGEMSRAELQMALQLRHRRHFTTAYLKPALKAKLVEMTLPDKPNSQTSAIAELPVARLWLCDSRQEMPPHEHRSHRLQSYEVIVVSSLRDLFIIFSISN